MAGFGARASASFEPLSAGTAVERVLAVVNQHGHTFIEFLNDSRFCVLNGRFMTDNFTSISSKGSAVVDYLCIPQDTFTKCNTFQVLTAQEIIDRYNLHGLIGVRSRLPDHSVLLAEIDIGVHETDYTYQDGVKSEDGLPKYKLKSIPSDFMESEMARTAVLNIIMRIESCRETQGEIDGIYDNLCQVILQEMSDKIPKIDSTRRTRKPNHQDSPSP